MDSDQLWQRFPAGLRIAVSSSDSSKLAGVREGFSSYLEGLAATGFPVEVHAEPDGEDSSFVPISDGETLMRARRRARALAARLETAAAPDSASAELPYDFFASAEGGVHVVELGDDSPLHFVRTWVAIVGPLGEAVGGSGSVQIPPPLVQTDGDRGAVPFAIPGTRRHGGLAGSLTGGVEGRRQAVALGTLHAASTLLYGVLQGRPLRPT